MIIVVCMTGNIFPIGLEGFRRYSNTTAIVVAYPHVGWSLFLALINRVNVLRGKL